VPFVYHIADMWPESVLESGMVGAGKVKKIAEGLINAWCDLMYRGARVITVLSPGFKDLLIKRGVDAGKIRVIYNWAEEDLFQPLPRNKAYADELGIAAGFNVIYAGNLGIFQGLDTLLRAATRLRDVPEIRFVLVGTGQAEQSLKKLAADLELHNVTFIGRQSTDYMPRINALADVLLVQLKDLDFFRATIPSKTQVCLASGKPIVMAVAGDAADLIRRSGAGLVCDPEDAAGMANAVLALFRMSAEERAQMGARGRSFYLQEMSLEVGGKLMAETFEACLEKP